MALEATYRRSRRTPTWIATVDYSAGEIVQVPDGRAGFILGLSTDNIEIGDEVEADCEAIAEVASASGTTFAVGATVGWDDTNNLAVTGGTGDFDIGKATKAKTSGQTTVWVAFNTQ